MGTLRAALFARPAAPVFLRAAGGFTPAAWKGKAARHVPGISRNRH